MNAVEQDKLESERDHFHTCLREMFGHDGKWLGGEIPVWVIDKLHGMWKNLHILPWTEKRGT